jgi:uncharacterized membrane protein YhaH (DUF805 family)
MSSPATDPAGGKPASPTRSKIRTGAFARALGVLFFIGNVTVLGPIFFLIGVVIDLVRIRGRLFPVGFRVRRGHFWNVILIYLSLGGLALAFIYAAAGEGGIISKTTANVLAGVLGGGMMASVLAVSVSRLHDRDLSGWWIFVYYGFPAAAIVRLSLVHPADWEFAVLVGVIGVFVLWAIFALGFKPGTIGPNRFGENPDPVPEIHASAAVTQAPAIATQALAAAVVSPTATALLAPMSAPAAPTDVHVRTREIVGDLISVNGRLDSRSYWICSAIQCAYALPAWLVIHLVTSDRDISQRAYWISVGVIAFLPAALSMIASAIKRLHDRDFSAWWLPGFLIILVAGLQVFFLIFDWQFVAMDGIFIFTIWGTAIWVFGSIPGTVGPNRFGPDPQD